MDIVNIVDFVDANGLRVELLEGPEDRTDPDGWQHQWTRMRLIDVRGKHIDTEYSAGMALDPVPNANDVLNAIVNDAMSYEQAETLEAFIAEFGFEDDERVRARRIFNACKRQAKALRKFLGDDAYEQVLTLDGL